MSLTSCLVASVVAVLGQAAPNGGVRVAVVNVGTVSERYIRTSELEGQFEQKRVKLNEQKKTLEDQIERTKKSLDEELKPGTQAFNDRRKQLAMQQAELQWFMDSEGAQIEAELAASLRDIFGDIQVAIKSVAEESHIELVLAADELPPDPPAKTAQARQQIVLQKVLYASPRVDITDQVVARVNATYKAQKVAGSGNVPPKTP